jgi:hypothetical protein
MRQPVGRIATTSCISLVAAAIALLLSIADPALAESTFSFDATPGKLPKTVVPINYAIELTPDLESLALGGVEVVDIAWCRRWTPGSRRANDAGQRKPA